MDGNKLDFVILTETWLDYTANTELAKTSPSNYSFEPLHHTERRSGRCYI